MKKFKAMTAGCFFVLAFAATVLAQGGPLGGAMGALPRGIFNPVVGSGAQYEIQPTGKDKMTVEIDVVGKEPVNGKDGYWFETAFDSHMGQMTMKMLMVSDAANSTIAKLIMQMHGAPPRSEEHTSELQSHLNLVSRLLLEKKKPTHTTMYASPACR